MQTQSEVRTKRAVRVRSAIVPIALWITFMIGVPGQLWADTLAVSGPIDNKIYFVSSAGAASPMATINYYPEGVVFWPGSTVLCVANWGANSINRMTSSGSLSTYVANITGPYGLAFDSRTNLFVAC